MHTEAKILGATAAAVIMLWLATKPAAAADGLWVADFRVTDEETMEPLEGAVISLSGVSRTTGTDGMVSFTIMPGTYDYTVVCAGYDSLGGTIQV